MPSVKIANSKKARAKQRKINKQIANGMDNYQGTLYVSDCGVAKDILYFDKEGAFHTGSGWNGHMWCEKDGKIYDPTPHHPQYKPITKKNGSSVKFYKRFDPEIEERIIQGKLDYVNDCDGFGGFDSLEDYLDNAYENPEPLMCFQNSLAYCRKNPEWKLCVGAFGYEVDYLPYDANTIVAKQLCNYISQQKGFNYVSLEFGF